MIMLILLCILGGSLIGVLNGLLGVGGAFIAIPIIDAVLTRMGFTPDIAHIMAIGTTPATILFTCISSYRAHLRNRVVRGDILRRMGAGAIIGCLGGALLAPHMPTMFLKLLFCAMLVGMGFYLLIGKKPACKNQEHLKFLGAAGLVFGLLASFTGIAGTLVTLTYLNWLGVNWRQSTGTSSGIGLITSITATLGFMISGWQVPNLPPYSLGFVYLPAVALLILPSMLMAIVGANLLNWKKMPIGLLKKCVGLMNIGVAINIIYSLYQASL